MGITQQFDIGNDEISVLETKVSPATAQAILSLKTGTIPPAHIKTHPGKGGKTFSYVSHIKGTQTMNEAFDQLWDWEILREQMYEDKSATAVGRLTLYFYDKTGGLFHKRTISEVGTKDFVDGMTHANIVASAASRSLLKCMLRAINFGAQLYKDDEDDFTPGQAWKLLETYAKLRGLPKDNLVEALKESGIDSKELVDRFSEVYQMVYDLSVEYLAEKKETQKQEALAKKLKKDASKQ